MLREKSNNPNLKGGELHCDDSFGEVRNELNNKRNALVPDIMNSTKWQRLLRQVQQTRASNPL